MATPDLAALKKQIDDLRAEYLNLTKKPAALFDSSNIANAEKAIRTLNAAISDAQRKAVELEEGFGGINETIQEIVNELNKGNDAASLATKAFKGIRGITENLKYDQQEINELSLKELKTQQTKTAKFQQQIRDQAKILQKQFGITNLAKEDLSIRDDINDNEKAILKAAKEGFPIFEEINNKLKERIIKEKIIEEKLGTTGKLLKGISQIPIIGNLIDADKALGAARDKIKDGGGRLAAMGVALKEVGKDVAKNLIDPLTITVFFVKSFYDILVGADKATGELAKNMNITYTDAAALKSEFAEVGKNIGDAFVNSRSMSESLMAINSALGTSVKLSNEELTTFTQLREEAGYTNEELVALEKLTLATGGNLKNNVKSFAGTVQLMNAQNKLSINEKQLLKEIANTSAAIKLSVGGTTEGLAKAAFQAKQFGINLEQADRIAESLLDFESSIENQISAELITGKELNLEKARLLALNGDIAGASAEILQQIKGSAEFTKMNRIQQEALAKAVGMNREDLAKSLVEREALTKLGGQDVEIDGKKVTLQEYYNKLKSDGMTQEQIVAKLGDESLAKQLEQTSNAEKFSAIIEKIKDAFIPIANELLPKINKAFDWLSKNTSLILNIMEGIAIVIGIKMVAGLVASIIKVGILAAEYTAAAAAATATNAATTFGLGTVAIIAGVSAVMGALAGYALSDGAIDPNGGLIVSKPKGGIIAQGIKEDNVVFTTNKLNSGGGGGSNVDMSPVIAELQNVRAVLNQILTKEGSVEMDSTKVGTTTNMGTYKVQ